MFTGKFLEVTTGDRVFENVNIQQSWLQTEFGCLMLFALWSVFHCQTLMVYSLDFAPDKKCKLLGFCVRREKSPTCCSYGGSVHIISYLMLF